MKKLLYILFLIPFSVFAQPTVNGNSQLQSLTTGKGIVKQTTGVQGGFYGAVTLTQRDAIPDSMKTINSTRITLLPDSTDQLWTSTGWVSYGYAKLNGGNTINGIQTYNGEVVLNTQFLNLKSASSVGFVNDQIAALPFKPQVNVATTGNIDLNNPPNTVDGVSTYVRILVWQQTDPTQNGIYVRPSPGQPLFRAIDSDDGPKLKSKILLVQDGTVNGNTLFKVLNKDDIILGTTPVIFSPAFVEKQRDNVFSGKNSYSTARTLGALDFDYKQARDSAINTANAGKQNTVTLTTTGTSGPATFNSTTGALNIPNYTTDLSGYTPTSRQIIAGTGLTGGGSFTADRTLNLDYTVLDARYSNLTGATNNSVLYYKNGVKSDPSVFSFDDVNKYVGINTATPTAPLTFGYNSAAGAVNGWHLYSTTDQVTNFSRVSILPVDGNGAIGFVSERGGSGISRGFGFTTLNHSFRMASGQTATNPNVDASAFGFYPTMNGTSSLTRGVGIYGTTTKNSGVLNYLNIYPTVNQSGTSSFTGVRIGPYLQSMGSGTNILFEVGTHSDIPANASAVFTSVFSINSTGTASFTNSPLMPSPTTGDNSTKGATTAFVQAALAGMKDNRLSKTADYTIVTGDFVAGFKTTLDLYVNASTGPVTITLPSATTFAGYTIYITKTDNSANAVTINTILGGNTLSTQYQSKQCNSDGTSWYNH